MPVVSSEQKEKLLHELFRDDEESQTPRPRSLVEDNFTHVLITLALKSPARHKNTDQHKDWGS